MTSIGKTEIPNVGTYLYAEAWAEGQIGGTGSNQRLPEYDGSDSEASVHMTGALARTGEQLTMDVTQGNDGNGHSTAAITLRNNCLQSQTSAELVATLLDAAGTVLETKKTSIGGAISGETFQTETVTFSRLGTRVVVRAAVPGNDLLTFEGLAVGLGDFTANGTNYTYTLQNDSGATSTLVTAVSGNGEPIFLPGTAHRPPCPAYHGCRSSSPIIRNRDAAYCVPVSSVRLWSHLPERHRNSPTIRRTTCSVCTSRNSTGREFTRSTSRPM